MLTHQKDNTVSVLEITLMISLVGGMGLGNLEKKISFKYFYQF